MSELASILNTFNAILHDLDQAMERRNEQVVSELKSVSSKMDRLIELAESKSASPFGLSNGLPGLSPFIRK